MNNRTVIAGLFESITESNEELTLVARLSVRLMTTFSRKISNLQQTLSSCVMCMHRPPCRAAPRTENPVSTHLCFLALHSSYDAWHQSLEPSATGEQDCQSARCCQAWLIPSAYYSFSCRSAAGNALLKRPLPTWGRWLTWQNESRQIQT